MMGLHIGEYQNRVVKKTISGSGSANKTQMEMMVKMLLPNATPDSDHSTDALAVALTHGILYRHEQVVQNSAMAMS